MNSNAVYKLLCRSYEQFKFFRIFGPKTQSSEVQKILLISVALKFGIQTFKLEVLKLYDNMFLDTF